MNKANNLITTLLALAGTQNEPFDAPLVTSQLREAAENNGLDASEQVPDWLLGFFEALRSQSPLAKQPIPASEPFTGEVANFLAELEDILQCAWHDSGEVVEVVADKLHMFGLISAEDGTYEVGALPS